MLRKETAKTGHSASSISRDLKAVGLKPYKTRAVLLLMAKNRKDRLAALPHLHALDWKKVLVCDEVPLHVIARPNPQIDRQWAREKLATGKPVPKAPCRVLHSCMGVSYDERTELAFYEDSLPTAKYGPIEAHPVADCQAQPPPAARWCPSTHCQVHW